MNTMLYTLTIFLIIILQFNSTESQITMEFMEGLPMEAVEQFIDMQLNRTISKSDRDSKMNAWAKKQGKKVQKQFDDFMIKMKKDDTKVIERRAKEVHNDVKKQLNVLYNDPKLSYKDVCLKIGEMAEMIADKVRAVGEKGPKSHTPCSIDSKQWPEDKKIQDK